MARLTITHTRPDSASLARLRCSLLAALRRAAPPAPPAMTSHAGWPPDQHLVMDKGPAGSANTLTGRPSVHNYLLGGYGNDTIYGGDAGDVIWGDYHPVRLAPLPDRGHPRGQRQELHLRQRHRQLRLDRHQPRDRRARPRGLRRDPLRKPAHRRLHEPPRPAALQAARLPPHQLLLRRLLTLDARVAHSATGAARDPRIRC